MIDELLDLPCCLLPILIVAFLKVGTSIIPLEELPIAPSLKFIKDK